MSEAYADCVENCNISYGFRSDHALVEMEIMLDSYKRGPGIWKLNNKLLNDEEYVHLIKTVIADTLKETPYMSKREQWGEIKTNCSKASKAYSKMIVQENRDHLQLLYELKDYLMKDLIRNSENKDIRREIERTNKEIEVIEVQKVQSMAFRAKCAWAEYEEKNSKLFFALEKQRYAAKHMKSIMTDCGRHITDQKEILLEQTKFFKGLYSQDKKVTFTLERGLTESYLSMGDKSICDSELMIDELFDAVMTLQTGKCPGGDDLTVLFYRKFYKQLTLPMYNMCIEAFQEGTLPISTRRGIISLLPKKNKDSRFVKNMRAITLLPVNYKIMAKVFDNRLRTVLPSLISMDQNGFMKNRKIAMNTRKSLDIIEFTRKEQVPAMILSIDMEKAFDLVSYSAIFKTLRYFNFGNKFIKWVKLFYTDFQVCTQNFGELSPFFSKERSLNQGCIILPAIYLLIGEVMANKLRNHPKIKGIQIGDVVHLISQFTDDTDLYLLYDQVVLDNVPSVLESIEANTGLKISYDKTVMYRIGSLAATNAKLYTKRKIKWTSEMVNTLGIDLYNSVNMLKKNFEKILLKIDTVTKMWYFCRLTLIGKVTLINALIGSLFVYKM